VRISVVAALVAAVVFAAACGYPDPYTTTGPVANESPAHGNPTPNTDNFHEGDGLPAVTYPDGLQVIDITKGTGAVAHTGDDVTVDYTGWLTDGTVFDSSRGRNQTFPFTIGKGDVIPGWDEGVPGMAVGGKRKLIIPSALAYGAQGQTDPNTGATIIPPDATLVFAITLVSVKPGPTPSPHPSPTPFGSPTPTPSASPKPS
jgi:FKBP-type peptidyl-prolyl cis-trans isomerase FkpA